MNAFRFIGKLEFNALDSKIPYLRVGKTSNGSDYQSFNFSVVPSKNNRAFVECFGMVNDKIKVKDANKQDLVVEWADRLNEDIIKKTAFYNRFSVKLDGVYHEFITEFDFIRFAVEHLEELKQGTFAVTGKIGINVYQGKVSFRYKVQSIREVTEEDKLENGLTVYLDTFFRKEDINLDNWSKEKEIIVNGFTYQYIDKDVKFKYVPTTFYINLAHEDNEKKAAFFLKQFGIVLENGSNKIKIKDKEVASLPIRCDFINGSEEIAFDESCLTDNQKEMVELGLKTLDDFKPNGGVYGQRITKFFCKDVDTRDKYADGYLVEQITTGEFETEIFAPAATEIKANDNKDNEDIDALFG